MATYKIQCFIKMLTKMNKNTIGRAKKLSKHISIEDTDSKGLLSNYLKNELLNRLLRTRSFYELLLIVVFFSK